MDGSGRARMCRGTRRPYDHGMRIDEVMTRDVVSVTPETSLKEVAQVLVDNHISGVPVCTTAGQVLGVVSEADILRKELGASPKLSRPLAWVANHLDGELAKLLARTAAEAMSPAPLTVRPTQHISEAARLMIDHRVNRLPVVGEQGLVGIVSRADLMRAFIRPDAELQREILEEVLLHTLQLSPGDVEVSVEGGRAYLRGRVHAAEDIEILEQCVLRVPGVLEVHTELHPA